MERLGVDAYRSPEWDKYAERSSCPEDAPPAKQDLHAMYEAEGAERAGSSALRLPEVHYEADHRANQVDPRTTAATAEKAREGPGPAEDC